MIIKSILKGISKVILDKLDKSYDEEEEYNKLSTHKFLKVMDYWIEGNYDRGESFPIQLTKEQITTVKNLIKSRAEIWKKWQQDLVENKLIYKGKDIRDGLVFQEMIAAYIIKMNENSITKYGLTPEIIDIYTNRIYKGLYQVSKEVTKNIYIQNKFRSKSRFFSEVLTAYIDVLSSLFTVTIKLSYKLFEHENIDNNSK